MQRDQDLSLLQPFKERYWEIRYHWNTISDPN